jgi:hypothetical protein
MHRFNERLALWITRHVGTMACAYLFAAITLSSLPDAILNVDDCCDIKHMIGE